MNPDSTSSFSHELHEEQVGDASLNQEAQPVDSSLYNSTVHLNNLNEQGDNSETVAEIAELPENAVACNWSSADCFLSAGIAAIIVFLFMIYRRIGKVLKILAPESAKSAKKGSIHPGMSNDQFIAIATAAATHLMQPIHPGLDNERFIALISAAAVHVLGENARIVKFKPMHAKDWTWANQGRTELQNHKI